MICTDNVYEEESHDIFSMNYIMINKVLIIQVFLIITLQVA